MKKWVFAAFGVALGTGILGACSSNNAVVDTTDSGPQCGSGATACGDTCAALATDNANCGACGKACTAGQVCSKGACAASCGGGTTQCGSTCNDTMIDPNNCGGCGTKCKAGEVCSSGKCASNCAMGQTTCGSSCVNTMTDNANCGGCGTLCGAGQVCSGGKCALTCQQGLTLCSMSMSDAGAPDASVDASSDAGGLAFPYCANLQSDDANCGGCGIACGAGQQCQAGACVTSCGLGQTMCMGQDGGANYCASLQSDTLNCGVCGKTCGGNTPVCSGGKCSPAKFQFQLTQTIDGQTVTCSAVNNANVLYTECDDLKENNEYFPNGITCGPMWSMTNSAYSDTVGFCQSLTGTAKMEAYYTCSGTVQRTTWKNHVWGTFNDNGYTQHVRCYY